MKNYSYVPNRLSFRSTDRTTESSVFESFPSTEGSAKRSSVPTDDGSHIEKSSQIAHLRSELNSIKSDVAKLIEEGPLPFGLSKEGDSQQQEDHGPGRRKLTRKQTNPLVSPRFARKKVSEINENTIVFADDFTKLKVDIDKLKLELKKTSERESKMLWENQQLEHKIKSLLEDKQKANKDIKLLQMEIQQADSQKKSMEEAYLSIKAQHELSRKQQQSSLAELKRLQLAIEQLTAKLAEQKQKNAQLEAIVKAKDPQISNLQKQVLEQGMELAEYKKQKDRKLVPDKYKFEIKEKKLTGCQTEGGVVDEMEKQLAAFKGELRNREKTMQLMLKDIQGLEKVIKGMSGLQWQIGEQNKLIDELNAQLMKKEAKLMHFKMRGHSFNL